MKYELKKENLDYELKWLKDPNHTLNDYSDLIRHLLNEIYELKQLSLCSVSDSFFCDAKIVNGISNCKKQCEGCLKCLHTPKK